MADELFTNIKPRPGSRADGGIARDTPHLGGLLQQIENTVTNLRNEIERLNEQLVAEQQARSHLENIIKQVADIIVNGHKATGT